MRIVHLSDVHLSISNIEDLRNYYIESLNADLKMHHNLKSIDLILITGDLVDKGGLSLGNNPYQIFETEFINPIASNLGLDKTRFLLVPGNHDINTSEIEKADEYYLSKELNKEMANELLDKQRNQFSTSNKRIKQFKEFEAAFTSFKKDYSFSNNESVAVEHFDNFSVGFALINDSWRCSPALLPEQHFFGFKQLFNAKKVFEKYSTAINIAVFHHPLESINATESEDVDNILKAQNFDIAFFGHTHKHKYESIVSANGNILAIRGRAVFNNPKEATYKYQPGYNILDVNIADRTYRVLARKFIMSGYRFDKDVDSLPNGETSGSLVKASYYQLVPNSNSINEELPTSYSADVDRIVKLLIGKSLYPNQYVFIRELIQNSVDACNRIHEKQPDISPKIYVHINSVENFFEIIDEGDGMSKRVLRDHFSVIGKSISQEFIDSIHSVNLISQFGIGFISTFIAARKVSVTTKSENDDLISFEIEDVFRQFKYNRAAMWGNIRPRDTGTAIKVFLKAGFHPSILLSLAMHYCRHIKNLFFYHNGVLQQRNESWNLENGVFFFEKKNSKYDCKLTIGTSSRNMIASNRGFLISENSQQIIPFKFPFIIGGEVVFEPRAIDFDLSRTNIMDTEKSREFKMEISISLRSLFRQVLEGRNEQLTPLVVGYLQYYLINFDIHQSSIITSYSDFYSKAELIILTCEYFRLEFKNSFKTLQEIISFLKISNIQTIYYHDNELINDVDFIVAKSLSSRGNLIVKNRNIIVQFRDGYQNISLIQFMQIIAKEFNLRFIEIRSISSSEMARMRVNKDELPRRILVCLNEIENSYSTKVDLVYFGIDFKPTIRTEFEYIINCDHKSVKDLIKSIDTVDDTSLKIFLVGLLGLQLSEVFNNGDSLEIS